MKQQWRMYAARFDALARRERGLVFGAVLVGLVLLANTLLLEPQQVRYQTDSKNLAKTTTDLKIAEAQLFGAQAQLKDPDAANRTALEQGRKAMAALDVKLRLMESSLVPPNKMQGFLESLMFKNPSLELVALATLPPTTLIDRSREPKADAAPAAPGANGAAAVPVAPRITGPNIYKHGIEIKIAGNYNDLLLYLAAIERMPQRIIWNRLKLSTELYPRNEMTLTVYTLSLDKQWLVV